MSYLSATSDAEVISCKNTGSSSGSFVRRKVGRPGKQKSGKKVTGKWNKDELISFYTCSSIHLHYKVSWDKMVKFFNGREYNQIHNKFINTKKVRTTSENFWEANSMLQDKIDVQPRLGVSNQDFALIRVEMATFLEEKDEIEKTHLFTLGNSEIKDFLVPRATDGQSYEGINNIHIEMADEYYELLKSNSKEGLCVLDSNSLVRLMSDLNKYRRLEVENYVQILKS